jgi:hypothetical protein
MKSSIDWCDFYRNRTRNKNAQQAEKRAQKKANIIPRQKKSSRQKKVIKKFLVVHPKFPHQWVNFSLWFFQFQSFVCTSSDIDQSHERRFWSSGFNFVRLRRFHHFTALPIWHLNETLTIDFSFADITPSNYTYYSGK